MPLGNIAEILPPLTKAGGLEHSGDMPGICAPQGKGLYLICYDISQASRLARVLRVIKGYRTGGQKSVHECFLSASQAKGLSLYLTHLFNPREDRLLIWHVAEGKPFYGFGRAIPPKDALFWYFGD